MTGTWSEKQSLRLNIDQDVGSRLKFGASAQVLHSSTSRGIVGNDNAGTSPADALHHTPSFFDLRQRADGTWPGTPDMFGPRPLLSHFVTHTQAFVVGGIRAALRRNWPWSPCIAAVPEGAA